MADDPLLRYVTNPDRDVFALRGLPEEVVAVLFAYYSRSRTDLRTNLRELLQQDLAVVPAGPLDAPTLEVAREAARAFHEKWVVGYGHASVAEHAVVHLAVERCSIIAAKSLEQARLAAFTEKSTRYVRFDPATLVTDIGLPAPWTGTYESAARRLLARYAALADAAESALQARHPAPDGTSPRAHAATLRTHACDLVRGLLPAGVPTNVGLTLNARALEHHLSTLLGSPLAEVRRLAGAMRDEASLLVPTLLRYVAPRPYHDQAAARVAAYVPAPGPVAAAPAVRLLEHSHEPLRTLATAIAQDLSGLPWAQAWEAMEDAARALATVHAYLADRGPHDAPLRALEQVTFRFEVLCDYGAWRDLQRHRLVSASTPRLGADEGYWLSPELDELGLGAGARTALEDVVPTWRALVADHPWEAQYVVPLAYRVRYHLQADLRELFHLVELRSARQGHPAYRAVAQALADGVLSVCPWLVEYLRVDRNEYPFARG